MFALKTFINEVVLIEQANMLREKLQTIIDNVLSNNEEWLKKYAIDVKRSGNYFILNYNIIGDKNEYNKLTRGLIISTDGKIVSFPFIRFFNFGEAHAEPVSLKDSQIIEKLDGTLVGLSFIRDENNKLIFHTRKMLSTSDVDLNVTIRLFDGTGVSLLKEIGKYIRQLKLSSDLYNFTLIFEAIITERPVVTTYTREELGLYLIGARDLETYSELSEDGLNELAKKIGAKRPRVFDVAEDYDRAIKMMDQFSDDFEGFVVRQRDTGKRVKLKKESYLKRHRLLDKMNYKNIIPLWFAGEQDEIISYFPAARSLFNKVAIQFDSLLDKIEKAYNDVITIDDRKQFALKVLADYKNISSILFAMFGKKNLNVKGFLFEFLKKQNISNVMNYLGITENVEQIDASSSSSLEDL